MSTTTNPTTNKSIVELDAATVRFAGDSGDGMQLAGTQLTNTSALAGNDIATFPDFPAEIRAPRGTLAGVSGFQIHFAVPRYLYAGRRSGCVGGDESGRVEDQPRRSRRRWHSDRQRRCLRQEGHGAGRLRQRIRSKMAALEKYKLFEVPMTTLTRKAVEGLGLSQKAADRCRNFFAMGLVYWLYGRSLEPTLRFIEEKFGSKPEIAEANRMR